MNANAQSLINQFSFISPSRPYIGGLFCVVGFTLLVISFKFHENCDDPLTAGLSVVLFATSWLATVHGGLLILIGKGLFNVISYLLT